MNVCVYVWVTVCVIWYIFNDDFIYPIPFDLQVQCANETSVQFKI